MTATLIAMPRPLRRQMSRWQHALEEVAVALGPDADADIDGAGRGRPVSFESAGEDVATRCRPEASGPNPS